MIIPVKPIFISFSVWMGKVASTPATHSLIYIFLPLGMTVVPTSSIELAGRYKNIRDMYHLNN